MTDEETQARAQIAKNWLDIARQEAGGGTVEDRCVAIMQWIGRTIHPLNPRLPMDNPIDILEAGRGWCDQQVKVFLWIVGKLYGVKTREVALYHTDGSSGHTVAEVLSSGAWRLFDAASDHQAVYRHPDTGGIMGYLDICDHVDVVRAEKHPWRGKNGQGKEGFYAVAVLHAGLSPNNGPGAAYCDYYPARYS